VNLVVNAIKFTPRDGRVTVRVGLAAGAEAHGRGARRVAELVVSDTGPGVPEEERARVFERGVRLARDAALPGSGIGLAVVREVVTQHGGKVVVRALREGGAEFAVSLPLDLRGRSRDGGLVLVRDAASVDRLMQALRDAKGYVSLASSTREELVHAIDACRAVIVVPSGADLIAAVGREPTRGAP
jgi:hypothetical protein